MPPCACLTSIQTMLQLQPPFKSQRGSAAQESSSLHHTPSRRQATTASLTQSSQCALPLDAKEDLYPLSMQWTATTQRGLTNQVTYCQRQHNPEGACQCSNLRTQHSIRNPALRGFKHIVRVLEPGTDQTRWSVAGQAALPHPTRNGNAQPKIIRFKACT